MTIENDGTLNATGGEGINVIDNVNSTSATDALSANQGRVLNDKIANNITSINEAKEDITNLENTRLTADNLIQGDNITLSKVGNNVTINATGGSGSLTGTVLYENNSPDYAYSYVSLSDNISNYKFLSVCAVFKYSTYSPNISNTKTWLYVPIDDNTILTNVSCRRIVIVSNSDVRNVEANFALYNFDGRTTLNIRRNNGFVITTNENIYVTDDFSPAIIKVIGYK